MIDEHDAWVVLASVSGVGPATFGRLLRRYSSAANVLELARTPAGRRVIQAGRRGGRGGGSSAGTQLEEPGEPEAVVDDRGRLPDAVLDALGRAATQPGTLLSGLRTSGVVALTLEDAAYPGLLRATEEPPPVLFVLGSVAALHARCIAVVGTRRPTEAGRRISARIAGAICRSGGCVVSGLAIGVDGAAHAAAVASGGTTVAVLGSGINRLFPRVHARLADAIMGSGGALVSEFAPDAVPTRGTFPRRNRVISGLSEAQRSLSRRATGAGHSSPRAGRSSRVGRAISCPARSTRRNATRCLAFLRAYPGEARIVAGVPELLDDLGPAPAVDRSPDAHPAPRDVGYVAAGDGRLRQSGPATRAALVATLGVSEAVIAGTLVEGLTTVDEIAAGCGLPVATVLATLTLLEIRGLVVQAYGRYRPAGVLASMAPAGA